MSTMPPLRLLGCHRDEIAIVENATRAWDMAFYAIPFGPGDRILTAVAEYASNVIAFLQMARKTGAVVEVIPNEASGQLSVEALRRAIDPTRQTDRHHPCPDQRRPGQSCRSGGAGGARSRGAVSVGCLPIHRANPPRCRGHGVRSALGHRAQISARSAGDRVVVCAAADSRPPGATVPGFTRGPVGRTRGL